MWFYEDLQDLQELTPIKDALFIIGDWNAKVGSEEIPGVTGKCIFSCERKKQTLSGQLLALAQALMANTRGPTGGLRQSSVALLPPAGCGKVARMHTELSGFSRQSWHF